MLLMRVGIVGCGCIGTEVALAVDSGRIPSELVAVCDLIPSKAENLVAQLTRKPEVVDISTLSGMSDIVVEAASKNAVRPVVEAAMSAGCDVLVMSVGGLLAEPDLFERARQEGCKVWITSGALAGLDAVKAGSKGGLRSVTLTTRKPPEGLRGAPYIVRQGIDLEKVTGETVIFEGNALQAVDAFPQNVNVAAALSFAGIGAGQTKVRVVTSPEYSSNSHEVIAEGAFGRLVAKTENLPSPVNPKTSYLASLSAIAVLQEAAELHLLMQKKSQRDAIKR